MDNAVKINKETNSNKENRFMNSRMEKKHKQEEHFAEKNDINHLIMILKIFFVLSFLLESQNKKFKEMKAVTPVNEI